MARGGAVDIPGNSPGQGITISSTYTYIRDVCGAPTGAVEGAGRGKKCAISRDCARFISRKGNSYAIKTQ
eukprot:4053993-Prymnesium_polylepis.1